LLLLTKVSIKSVGLTLIEIFDFVPERSRRIELMIC